MTNQKNEILGIDKSSNFSLRVLILSIPAGLIFLILGLLEILQPFYAFISYICILFFNTVFLMPMSTEILQIKKYIQALASGTLEKDLIKNMTEKETRDLTEAINSMHKFWVNKTELLENRTLSDAAVLDTLPDPLLMVNKNSQIIGANLSARRLFANDLNNQEITNYINDAKFDAELQKILSLEVRQSDLNIRLTYLKDRPKYFVRISTLPWFAKGDIVAVISLYDINKVLKFEQMQQDFVANASHELRTPLSIIAGFIETLQTSAKNDEKAREKFLHIMQEQTSYMSKLIENLLSLSKIELSIPNLPDEKVAINSTIREIKDALEIKAKNNNLKIETTFARLPKIIGDQRQITQVIQNLLDNAIKYGDANTVINISTKKADLIPHNQYYEVATGECVEIAISNYGVTISKEDLERLTERFYRLQEHKNRNIKGTGLGLSIISQIIKRHKGNMRITSVDGLTTFYIYLPINIS